MTIHYAKTDTTSRTITGAILSERLRVNDPIGDRILQNR
jgi:hypothetical protein